VRAVPSRVTARYVDLQPGELHDELAWQKLILECQTEAAADGILTVSADGVVLAINRACREIFELGEEVARPGVDERRLVEHIATLLARPSALVEALAAIARAPLVPSTEQLAFHDGREVRWTSRPIVDRDGHCRGRVNYYYDITRMVCAERDAVANEARTRATIDGAGDAIVSLDHDLHILDFNRSAGRIFGWNRDVIWEAFDEVAVEPEGREGLVRWLHDQSARPAGHSERAEFLLLRQTGKGFPAECAVAHRDGTVWVPFTLFARDVSVEKRLETELRQAQKLESVGRLASGIAHEINTPLQFVGDSLYFIRDAVTDLLRALGRCQALRETVAAVPEAVLALDEIFADADLGFLEDNAPKAIERALEGLGRVGTLVQGMKEFAHPGVKEKSPADLNRALEMTLTIARNEYKLVADVETDLGALPLVTCVIGEINQAFLNVVVNAAHAIADVVQGTSARGRIGVRTWRDGDSAFVAISDTGTGIPEGIRDRLFDPFFTTKAVGRGTGQGLAIAHSVVVDKHGGDLRFETQPGRGTTFTIRLPLEPPDPSATPE
jgi:PAS domain S-box-containing protein